MGRSERQIRVLVADDSRIVLQSICDFLVYDGRFDVVGTAHDGLALVEKAKTLQPDLVLLDLSMPKLNGLHAAREIRKQSPEIRILILSGSEGAPMEEECQRSGADGFVEKSQVPGKLMQEVLRLFPQIEEPTVSEHGKS